MKLVRFLKYLFHKVFKTFVRFFVYSLVLRCKQVYVVRTSFSLQKSAQEEAAMTAVLGKSISDDLKEDQIVGKLKDQIEDFRKKLENSFCSESLRLLISEELENFSRIKPTKGKKPFILASTLLQSVNFKVQGWLFSNAENLSLESQKTTQDIINYSYFWSKILKSFYDAPSTLSSNSNSQAFRKWARLCELIAEYVDHNFNSSSFIPKEDSQVIEGICIKLLQFTSVLNRLDDESKNSSLKRIHFSCYFAFQKIQQRKEKSCNDLIIGKEPFEQLFKKSKERVAQMGWLRTDEEIDRLVEANEEETKEKKKTLEYLSKILNSNND